MRHKVYTREQIIKAAYNVIKEHGFSNFTARNVAKEMGGSTQPIYIHFKSMQELKIAVVESLRLTMNRQLSAHENKTVQDQCLNYLEFARKNLKMFQALFQDSSGMGKYLYDWSLDEFKKDARHTPEMVNLSDEKISSIHDSVWVAITGLALLDYTGIVKKTPDQQLIFINEIISSSINSLEV